MIGIIFNIEDVRDLVKSIGIETGKNNMIFVVMNNIMTN